MKNKNTLLREVDEYVNSIYDFARNQNGMYTQVQVRQAYIDGKKSMQKENAELEQQIEKMKCCENCKYNSYWGNELHCNYGLKEALQKDKLVECKNMDKWEIKEK